MIPIGFEPMAYCLEGSCSIQLSYGTQKTFKVYSLRFKVKGLQFTVYSLRFTVYGLQFTVYGLRFTVYGLRFTVYVLGLPAISQARATDGGDYGLK